MCPRRAANILDVSAVPIAQSRPIVRLRVAPKELKDRAATARALAKIGVPREWVSRATDVRRAWVIFRARTCRATRQRLRTCAACTPMQAWSASTRSARRCDGWSGVVDARGVAVDGLELTLDSLLRGQERVTRLARDSHGARIDAPDDDAPEAGDDVVLTINQSLQEISDRALADALVGTGADGGDIVDHRSARRRDPRDGQPAHRSAIVGQPRGERALRAGIDAQAVDGRRGCCSSGARSPTRS